LVGELPTLWLPVKAGGGQNARTLPMLASGDNLPTNERPQTPSDAARLLALAAPHRFLSKLLHHRSKPAMLSEGTVHPDANQPFYQPDNPCPAPESAGYAELTEVHVHAASPAPVPEVTAQPPVLPDDRPRTSQMALTPILEVVTPRSSIFVKSPNISAETSGTRLTEGARLDEDNRRPEASDDLQAHRSSTASQNGSYAP
ncbi:hypothetical protein GGI18_005538, partial [Coemansia linderi]